MSNPCDEDLVFTTVDACLVSTWALMNLGTGEVYGLSLPCPPAETDWDVPAEDSIENVMGWGRLESGSYEMEATFDDEAATTASSRFKVL